MHTFYFIFYLILAAKMYHLSVAPAKILHLSVGEPYTWIYFILSFLFRSCCQDVSSFGSTYQDVSFSVEEPYTCKLYHIHALFGFCMAAVAIINKLKPGTYKLNHCS